MNIIHTYKHIKNKKILFFDLDGTLIHTASGKTFPEDVTDFKIDKHILDKVKSLDEIEHLFVVSNQAGIPEYYAKEEFNIKFDSIMSFIKDYINLNRCKKINVKGLFCTAKNYNAKNRKPNTGMLERCLKNLNYEKSDMVMIGDASGIHNETRDDFSDSDLRTARKFDIDYIDVVEFSNLTKK